MLNFTRMYGFDIAILTQFDTLYHIRVNPPRLQKIFYKIMIFVQCLKKLAITKIITLCFEMTLTRIPRYFAFCV